MKYFWIAPIGAALFTLGISGSAEAASFLGTSGGEVGTIDPSTGVFVPTITGTPTFFDIAIDSNNNLFGATSASNLYSIDLTAETTSLIGNSGTFLNGLGFDDTDVLYGTGNSGFYTIDISTGAASLVANISGFNSSGDLAYDAEGERFLATSTSSATDRLWSIEKDGTATIIGDLGFNSVYGLFFENGTLFGYTANRDQISIDITTGAGTFENVVSGTNSQIFGAASSTSSVPEPTTLLGLLTFGFLGMSSVLKRK